MLKDKDILLLLQGEGLSIDDIVNYVEIIITLRQKYGLKIFIEDFLEIFKSIDKNIFILLSLFKYLKISNIAHMKIVKSLAKKDTSYNPRIDIVVARKRDYEIISKYINKVIPKSITQWKEIDSSIGKGTSVNVCGDGWHYKRSFDADIEKLLG